MYYPYFIAYMSAGFVISIVVFIWALNNGQFKDQQRARFIPLENDPNPNPAPPSRATNPLSWEAKIGDTSIPIEIVRFGKFRRLTDGRHRVDGYNIYFDADGATATALMVKIVGSVLARHPWLNSSFQGEEIHLFRDINIGVAVADNPAGPFEDPIGQALIPQRADLNTDVEWCFDPGAFLDDDGRAYVAFGGGPSGKEVLARLHVVGLGDGLLHGLVVGDGADDAYLCCPAGVDALLHQPECEVRMVTRPLATDAHVLSRFATGSNGHR